VLKAWKHGSGEELDMRSPEKIVRSGVGTALLAIMLASAGPVMAGNPTPTGPPSNPGPRYTLGSVYLQLTTGANPGPLTGPFLEPTAPPPTSPVFTVDQILQVAPALDDANGAVVGEVVLGRTFWGLRAGGWGLLTGAMPNNGAVTLTPTTADQAILAGYHNGSGKVAGDVALVATNIKSGVTIFGVTGTLSSSVQTVAQPGKTGQTTSYGARDDGALQKGVSWPNPRFTDNLNGTVTDNLTKLIWLKNANCWGTATWATALANSNALIGNNTMCGLSDGSVLNDWRLPNRFELESLLDLQYFNPPISNVDGTTGPCGTGGTCAFTGIQISWYWTSSTNASNASNAWFVYLDVGVVSNFGKTSRSYVWPVRGGQ
jgi:hypothetical protein